MTQRTGSLLIEITLALSLVAVAGVTIAQLLVISSHHRREADWNSVATREVANQMEHIMSLPWPQISTESLAERTLSTTAQERLHAAELQILVSESNRDGRQKEIRVLLSWQNSAGRPVKPIALSAWTFAQGGNE